MREKEMRLEKEEAERKKRILLSEKLEGTWKLMRICKEYLAEWEGDWTEGSEKSELRRIQKDAIENRFKRI